MLRPPWPRATFPQDHRRSARRNSGAEEHHQHDGGSAQRVRQRSHARGARGRHRRQAGRPGGCEGRRRDVARSDGERQFDGVEPDQPGPQHRRSYDCRRERRSRPQDHGRCARRNSGAEEHHQHDGGSAQLVRFGSYARGARSRYRRQAGRTGGCARRGRHVERSDRFGQLHGVEPDQSGA